MVVTQTDRKILHWACIHGYEGDYVRHPNATKPWLKVVLRWATAWFQDGTLVRIVVSRDERHLDRLTVEMAGLFALCAVIEADRSRSVNECAAAEDTRPGTSGQARHAPKRRARFAMLSRNG